MQRAKSERTTLTLRWWVCYLLSQLIYLEMGSQVHFRKSNTKIKEAYVIELREKKYLFLGRSVWKLIKRKHKCWSSILFRGRCYKIDELSFFSFFLHSISCPPPRCSILLYIFSLNASRFYTWRVGITLLEFLSHLEHTSNLYT